MSWGTTTSRIGGSFLHSEENPFGPNAGIAINVNDAIEPTSSPQIIPDMNVLNTNLQSPDSGLFGQPMPSQLWAFEAAVTSRSLGLLVAQNKDMKTKVAALSRPEWERRIGILLQTLELAHDQARNLCNVVDPAFKPATDASSKPQ